jgi:hypothetical protein
VKTVVTSAPKPSFFHYFGMPMTEEEEADAEENEDEEAVQVRLGLGGFIWECLYAQLRLVLPSVSCTSA